MMSTSTTTETTTEKIYKCIYCNRDSHKKGSLASHIWSWHRDQPRIQTFRDAYDLVFSDSYPLIEGVGTEERNHSSSSSSFETIVKDRGVISSLLSSSAIVSNNALNDTIEKVDDEMEHTSLAVERREKTIDELSREANANREAILDALIAQAGMEDGMEDGGGGGGQSRSRKASISKQKEKKERRVIPRRSVKRKRSSRIRKPTDFFGRSSDMIDEEEEEEEEFGNEDEDEDGNDNDNDDDGDEDPYDSDATEPYCKIRKLNTTSSSSSGSGGAGGSARRRSIGVIHASPPLSLPLGSKALPFSCQVPDCDQAGVTFPGVTESDRRSAGEAHIKSMHKGYVNDFEKKGGRVCVTCGKGFEGTSASVCLSIHKRFHDSLDWKVCDFCHHSAAGNCDVKRHILRCTMNPDRASPTVKCKHCNEQVTNISTHLAAHHGIGKFYKCLFCDYEIYSKRDLVDHIFSMHKDKPTMEATRGIVYADSFPFEMRNGSGSSGGKLRK